MGDVRPTGTVCFLFTDVESSTPLWDRAPAEMASALERHDILMRAAIGDAGGVVFSTAGDSFAAAFHTPTDAVSAASTAQVAFDAESWPPDALIKVRMGIHLGPAQERAGDYFGSTVNRAARLMGLAHGGQILLSAPAATLVSQARHDLHLEELGVHELRGLSQPETVFQLLIDGLQQDFPLLGNQASVTGNLPIPPTSFLGRRDDVRHLMLALRDNRLTTLVGPGGVGKTRLSIAAATEVQGDFEDGVWFVELAAVVESEAAVHATLSTLSILPSADVPAIELLVEAISGRRLLLILDNCEHVLASAAAIAAAILARAPLVRILATSREPLGVGGERLRPVAPLDAASEGVALFIERARAVDPEFAVTSEEAAKLVGLCADLDGVPLAIELAAARVRSMTIEDIIDRLHDRFRLLRASRRADRDNRQSTLRAAVDWSFRLLSLDEQILFARLSVFAGGFDLDAVVAICTGDDLEEFDIIDLMDGLVDRSMVQADRTGRHVRFTLLETLRHYGVEITVDGGEHDELRDRHLVYYADLTRQAQQWFEQSQSDAGQAVFERDWDNIRKALDHAHLSDDGRRSDMIIGSTHWYSFFALREEHSRWTRRRIEATRDADQRVLGSACMWDAVLGNHESAVQLGRLATKDRAADGEPPSLVAWYGLVTSLWFSGRRQEAIDADSTAYELAAASDDRLSAAMVVSNTRVVAVHSPTAALSRIAESRELAKGLDNPAVQAAIACYAGFAAQGDGDLATAMSHWRLGLELAATGGNRMAEGVMLATLAVHSASLDDGTDPGELFRAAIARLHAMYLRGHCFWALAGLAGWWADIGRIEQVGHVIGYLDRHDPGGNETTNDIRAKATAVVGQTPAGSSWREAGAELNFDEIVAYCLDHLGEVARADC